MNNFIHTWQYLPEHISPIALSIGGFELRWYGLMYIVAFIVAYILMRHRIKKEKLSYTPKLIEDFMTWGILGVIIGGRLGYVLFYNLNYYLIHPFEIFIPFRFDQGVEFVGLSGMSYHGGLIGVAIAIWVFTRRHKLNFLKFGDFITSVVPLGYTFGRIGNFLNGELYGRVTDAPIGMYFTNAPTFALRHPSQLYEALFEGLILFVIIWFLKNKKIVDGGLFCSYVIGYGVFRFFIEYVREPDAHLGFISFGLTMGQLLCTAMVIAGCSLFALLNAQQKKIS